MFKAFKQLLYSKKMEGYNIVILCLDQSTTITGYSVYKDKELISYGTLVAEGDNVINRMKTMKEKIKRLIKIHNPDVVVLEDTQLQGNNPKTFQTLSQLQGVIISLLLDDDKIMFTIVRPSEWRFVCGIKGRERKVQKKNTQLYVKQRFDIDVSEDEADAICIGIWATKKITKN